MSLASIVEKFASATVIIVKRIVAFASFWPSEYLDPYDQVILIKVIDITDISRHKESSEGFNFESWRKPTLDQ